MLNALLMSSLTDTPLLDPERLDLLLSLGDDAFVEIAQSFLTDLAESLATLSLAIRNDDADGLSKAAHRLKGGAANFGAPRAAEAARKLEHGEAPLPTVDELETVLTETADAIRLRLDASPI